MTVQYPRLAAGRASLTARFARAGMRRIAAFAVAALIALCGAGPLAPAAHAQAQKSPYKTMVLPNGLEIVVIENRAVPLATISIAVRNGAFTEPDDYAGLSHLYEHMFFKANAAIPSQEQFMKRIRELGIVFNGYTSQEVVVYYFTLPSRNLDAGTKFMADAIKTPIFNEEELVKEREVVLGEFDRNEAQPTFALNYAIDSALWIKHIARKQPLGQRPVIKNATVTQMRMIKDLFYLPNNSALIVSGDVKAQEVFALAKKYLGDWKRGNPPFPSYSPPPFPELKSKLVIREAKIPDIDLRLHFRGPSVRKDDPDAFVASTLTTLINQPTSRFYHVMIDSGVVTSGYGGYSVSQNVGAFSVYLRTTKEKAARALELAKAEIAAMRAPGYFTAEELETARRIALDQRLFDQDNPQGFAIGTSARWWSMASLDYYLKYAENIRKVTPKQISDFVSKYLYGRPMVIGIGGERAALDQLNITEEALTWR